MFDHFFRILKVKRLSLYPSSALFLCAQCLGAVIVDAHAKNILPTLSDEQLLEWVSPSRYTVKFGTDIKFHLYSNGSKREHSYAPGISGAFQYLDRSYLTYRIAKTTGEIEKAGNHSERFIELGVGYHAYIDRLEGRVTSEYRNYRAKGSLHDSALGTLKAHALSVSYLTYKRDLFADIHWTAIDYDRLHGVSQWDMAVGFPVFNHWMEARLYMTEESRKAIDLLFRKSLPEASLFKVDRVSFAFLMGERLYPLDRTINTLANFSDGEHEHLKLGLEWLQPDRTAIDFWVGVTERCRMDDHENYFNAYFNLGYKKEW